MPLDFSEEVITWVALELSGSSGALGAEALKLKNWLLRFGCVSEELWVEVSGLVGFLGKYPPPLGRLQSPDGL